VLLLILSSERGLGQGRRLLVPRDHETVAAALEQARAGDVVEVGAGVFEENVTVGPGVTLRGKGPDKTIIRGDPGASVLTAVAGDKVRIEKIALEHPKPERPAKRAPAVVFLRGRDMHLQDARIGTGHGPGVLITDGSLEAVGLEVRDCVGSGLHVINADATLSRCVFIFNGGAGVEVNGPSELSMRKSSAEANKGCGVDVNGEGARATLVEVISKLNVRKGVRVIGASGSAKDCQSLSNEEDGLICRGSPAFELDGGVMKGNRTLGVWIGGEAKVVIKGTRILGNESGGLTAVHAKTDVRMTDVTVSDNKAHGIRITQGARGEVRDSTCSGNAHSGLSAADEGTHVVFEKNTCTGNFMHGLAVVEKAKGRLKNNTASNNKIQGFGVFGKAEAHLERNKAEGNGHNGLQVWKAGKAVLERNTFDKNGQNGIEVNGKGSTIQLKRNRCRGNASYGVLFVSGAEGFKVGRDNELKKNRKGRVRVK